MKQFILIVISILITSLSYAQKKKSPWSFSSNNSFAFFSGNVNKFDAVTANELEHSDSSYEFSLDYQFLYGEQNDNKYLLEHMASAFYDYRPYKRLSPWTNATFLHNIYKGFQTRLNAAAGVKYRFIYKPDHDWSVSTGIMWDHSNFSTPTEASTSQRNTESIWRLSIRPKIKVKLSESAKLKHITFYQPELKDFNNFIAWSQTEFSVKVIEHISLSAMYYYFYNSRPAYETIFKTDQRILFGVKVDM